MERYFLVAIIVGAFYLLLKDIFTSKVDTRSTADLNIRDLTLNVKSQLKELDSIREKNKELPLFKVESFDLEINFAIKQVQNSDNKFEYKVLTIEDKNEFSKEQIQKITLHMKTTSSNHGNTPASE
jgi:Trypsin-co-occurring domain 2